MPKVLITESQKASDRLRNNLMLLKGARSNAEMSKIIGKSAATFGNRLKNPEQLTYEEARLLCTRFKVSIAEFSSAELRIGANL